MYDGGRERDCKEPVEYCDNRFLEAWDIGRGSVDLLFGFGGDVIRGGRGGWFGLTPGDETGGGEVAGDDVGDMTAVILSVYLAQRRVNDGGADNVRLLLGDTVACGTLRLTASKLGPLLPRTALCCPSSRILLLLCPSDGVVTAYGHRLCFCGSAAPVRIQFV
jgi:hypothetical protein